MNARLEFEQFYIRVPLREADGDEIRQFQKEGWDGGAACFGESAKRGHDDVSLNM